MSSPFPIASADLREAIAKACKVTDTVDDPGKVADALVTFSQAKALDFRTSVVRGGRGSGKSFWWAALQREEHRNWIANTLGAKVSRVDNLSVIAGFGVASRPNIYPSPRVLDGLAKTHAEHLEDIWMTILLNQALDPSTSPYQGINKWSDRVDWTSQNVEEVEGLLGGLAARFEDENRHLMIAFDGLDRLASNWDEIRPIARSVLRFALQLQSFSRIRAKVFLRPDMFEDAQIVAFPDASKLIDSHARLDWNSVALFSLFFQRMANADQEQAAEAFRDGVNLILKQEGQLSQAWQKKAGVWELPSSIKGEPKIQREVFHAITGGTMSHNQDSVKRGYPYTWLPNHLADSHGEISPRSFLAALREAAAIEPPSNTSLPLYFTGIQRGVSAASQTRVADITEDYPWVGAVMSVLNGQINVPCDEGDILSLWQNHNIVEQIKGLQTSDQNEFSSKLGPTLTEQNLTDGIFENLIRLGIFSRQKGNRVQMPDVYRVAFGIGRKGGIKPIRQSPR
jgi:hypothetical protein